MTELERIERLLDAEGPVVLTVRCEGRGCGLVLAEVRRTPLGLVWHAHRSGPNGSRTRFAIVEPVVVGGGPLTTVCVRHRTRSVDPAEVTDAVQRCDDKLFV